MRRAARNLAWQRRLDLHISLECPERWESASTRLSALLSFMTDDEWTFKFVGIASPSSNAEQIALWPAERISEVALFSGGLDSVAGMFARGRESNTMLAVSACGSDVRAAAQAGALGTLRMLGVRANWLRLNHQLRDAHRSRSQMESSQRSRGLVFLAMGAAAASQLELDTFSVYETGTGCINLPTSVAQVGAEGTRAMHPRTLTLFNELVEHVLDRPVRAVAPFFLHTKGELCRLAGSDLNALASVASSCDEGEGHKRKAMLHCGLCTSCLFRRIALHSAGLVPDPTPYRDTRTKRHDEYELHAFASQAEDFRKCNSFADLLQLDPDARFATALPTTSPMDPTHASEAVFALYRRYESEIRLFLETARPTVATSAAHPRKAAQRDLFAAAG